MALLWAIACGGGEPANEPGAVADRFVDLYFIEIDQARVLPLTAGVARARIEDEIEQVKSVRATGYTANAAKPKVFYDRVMFETAGDRARAIYDIRIKHPGGVTHRHVLVSLSKREAGQWKVSSFTLRDGKANGR